MKVLSGVCQGAGNVDVASAEIAQGNHALSLRIQHQAVALEKTTVSMGELRTIVSQNADSAHQANTLAVTASNVASQGGQVVQSVMENMKSINDSSKKISDIISVIDGIAFQTNILALNAAVEAARAGEQGRGFAVVASEVRNLAGRAAKAAQEIKQLITVSMERVEKGTILADKAGATINDVVGSIQRVTNIVGEITVASEQQSARVARVTDAITKMDQATRQNASLVESIAVAASSMKAEAKDLVEKVAIFKLNARDLRDGMAGPVRSAQFGNSTESGTRLVIPRIV